VGPKYSHETRLIHQEFFSLSSSLCAIDHTDEDIGTYRSSSRFSLGVKHEMIYHKIVAGQTGYPAEQYGEENYFPGDLDHTEGSGAKLVAF
jgi:hypothetical protein